MNRRAPIRRLPSAHRLAGVLVSISLAGAATGPSPSTPSPAAAPMMPVIVRAAPGAARGSEQAVEPPHLRNGVNGDTDPEGPLTTAGELVGAPSYWEEGITGRGVDVALIDTGVAPVEGLAAPGQVVNGPDLSFDSQATNHRHLDGHGHGTHMAGIIAGRDDDDDALEDDDSDGGIGVAPGARIINVKVGDYGGATDVSQVIAAIDWVVQHRNQGGLDIRVLNLSFGTDGSQSYKIDPLTFAAEMAWRKGIVVVVAAGNSGYGTSRLNDPAYDPSVIAVGAADTKGTEDTSDDTVPEWSSRGDPARHPDIAAPGTSIASLRVAGSWIDLNHPEGRVGSRWFRGGGTSQAAAFVSGAAALMIQQRPSITPDEVKETLTSSATPLPSADALGQGAGLLDLDQALHAPTAAATQAPSIATGIGSLELARGSSHLADGMIELRGSLDIFGAGWDSRRRALETRLGMSWSGGIFNGNRWAGDGWAGDRWLDTAWTAPSWSGTAWSEFDPSDNYWTGHRWSGGTWSGHRWSSDTWSGNRWSSVEWGS